jgi:hypothetical protein
VYFPPPSIVNRADTLNTYGSAYSLFIKFFHASNEKAYETALPAYTKISRQKSKISLVDADGNPEGGYVHITSCSLSRVDDGAYQLQVEWISRKYYDKPSDELAQNFYLNGGKV